MNIQEVEKMCETGTAIEIDKSIVGINPGSPLARGDIGYAVCLTHLREGASLPIADGSVLPALDVTIRLVRRVDFQYLADNYELGRESGLVGKGKSFPDFWHNSLSSHNYYRIERERWAAQNK